MAFYQNAYNTLQYEVRALADSATSLPVGTAVVFEELATGPSTPGLYYKVNAAVTASPSIDGVVSTNNSNPITDLIPGKIVGINAGLIPVLMNANGMKGQYIKVKTATGKFEVCGAGEISAAVLMEDATANNLAWAKPIRVTV